MVIIMRITITTDFARLRAGTCLRAGTHRQTRGQATALGACLRRKRGRQGVSGVLFYNSIYMKSI